MWKRDGEKNNFAEVAKFLTTPAGLTARASLIVAVKDLITASDLSKGGTDMTTAGYNSFINYSLNCSNICVFLFCFVF